MATLVTPRSVLEPKVAAKSLARKKEIPPVSVAVIGYGYWGPNLVRNLAETPGARVVAVADLNEERLDRVRERYPTVRTTTDVTEILTSPTVDAAVIATPVRTHFRLALAALRAGKHVLVEKPIASTSEEAMILIREAEARKLVLMVDHTFVYTGAVTKIRELVASGALGEIYYYDSVRVNLGLFQSDVNVLWDLAVHDLGIIDAVMPQKPVGVSAYGVSHVLGQPENIGYLTLIFPRNQIAHLHVNWLAPVKVRRTLIGCQEKMILYDDLEPSEKIKLYDKGAASLPTDEARHELLVSYRYGDMTAPRLDATEALRTEVLHFIDCINTGAKPLTDGGAGLRVVRILEAAEHSRRTGGGMVQVIPAAEYD